MRIPSEKQLSRNAKRYNRKAFKKNVRCSIKAIMKIITSMSKEGKSIYCKHFESEIEHFREYAIAFRWMRRYSGLRVKIEEEGFSHNGRKYIDAIDVTIYW